MRYDPAWLDADPLPQLIDGRESREGPTRPIVDPSTGESPASYAEATTAEVGAALAAARRSHDQGEWRRMPGAQKAQLLDAVAAEIRADATRLATLEALDTGKAVAGAITNDVYEAANAFSYAAAVARTLHGDVRRSSFPPELLPGGGPDLLTMRMREPAGVVAELLPWNGPLMTGSQRIAMALAGGCSIVAKPPEEAVVTLVELGRILTRCGLPAGVLNIVLGAGETVGEQLVTDPRVDLISLTGGTETGRRVMSLAARNLTPTHLELGGKSPVIVFADADLDQAVGWAMMAAFVNMGEVCVAGSRLLVEESVYDDVVKGVAAAAAGLPIGDALDHDTFIGPLITEQHAEKVRGFVSRAVAAGDAQVVGSPSVACSSRATFVPPTVLSGVRAGSEIEQQEVFGPVLAAMPFRTEEEAIALANGTSYGLNGTVFTRDLERAFRVSDALDCGEVNVNCHFAPDMNGGRGEPRRSSGHSRTGIDAYTRLKAVNIQIRS
ncbi:acyl-CoA reductase-like NAD-dependent aldehyde dehydrogenase [Thermocatellispora tengchongensis]|uniref:Acyl-CoA reductase-like NAD-dependent aldehyde dehydrogenase n=1 Tax=Thermocatellispora tengchongensis TaxID=1073253 RepID=A0A840P4K1_9ACTN|nr:aldehyde dehydrogenase family protein [Thermocatellispora tengchongensis]MBB5130975.1 acyl-CoA reductase-like NAD-dependent aldehyde dehydrogenase [Thermocatellispora tengchongensis]